MPVSPFAWIRSRLRRRANSAAPAPGAAHHQVRAYFQQKAAQQGYTLSHGQQQVIACMAALADQLATGEARSLYLYGAVGRGKSWLLDGFFRALPQADKRRLHFHDFFAHLHQGMFRHRLQDDALACTLDELLGDCRVLCFDEFHVHDIGDAMLLTRLFQALFERHIVLLLTSNYPPEGLLPNPLYHQRFLPVIRLINARMQVLEVAGEQDYRSHAAAGSQQHFTQGHYLWPGTAAQHHQLQLPALSACTLVVGQRTLQALHCHEGSVAFDFTALCEQATAVIDYLELARRFDHWLVVGLPDLGECSMAAQQRFANLIDVLYDQDKHLTLIGDRPLAERLGGTVADLARTRSRLGQLQVLGPLPCPA